LTASILQQQPDLWQSGTEWQLLRREVDPAGAGEKLQRPFLSTLFLAPELLASWLLPKATKNTIPESLPHCYGSIDPTDIVQF
jgi:hypothetical protein